MGNTNNYMNCIFTSVIIISCVCFVSWQSIKCIIKYIEMPQGTKQSLSYTGFHQFPAITVCSDPNRNKDVTVYNLEKLKKCGIDR